MHAFGMISFVNFVWLQFCSSRTKSVKYRVAIELYTFIQLTPEYKTPLNDETSCGITVQQCVKYGNFLFTEIMWLIILCLLFFIVSAVRQHKFKKLGL